MTEETPNDSVNVDQGSPASTATIDSTTETEHGGDSEELIAGKFKSQEDLVEAYKQLEQKLGANAGDGTEEGGDNEEEDSTQGKDDADEDDAETSGYGEAVDNALKAADVTVDDIKTEWSENGELSDESYQKLEKAGFPKAMVEAYIGGLSKQSQTAEQKAEATVREIKGSVGGDEAFTSLQEFISTQYSSDEIQQYQTEVESGDPARAKAAVEAAHARQKAEFGVEKQMIGGKTAPSKPGFASEAEMLEAMADPKYKTSQSYRDEVAQKIAKSTLLQTR